MSSTSSEGGVESNKLACRAASSLCKVLVISSEQVPKLSTSLTFVVISQSCVGAAFTSLTFELASAGHQDDNEYEQLATSFVPKQFAKLQPVQYNMLLYDDPAVQHKQICILQTAIGLT